MSINFKKLQDNFSNILDGFLVLMGLIGESKEQILSDDLEKIDIDREVEIVLNDSSGKSFEGIVTKAGKKYIEVETDSEVIRTNVNKILYVKMLNKSREDGGD